MWNNIKNYFRYHHIEHVMILFGPQGPLDRKFHALADWSVEEQAAIRSLGARRKRLGAHQQLVRENDAIADVFVVQFGWTCIYKLLPDGGRQVLAFPLPGDIVGVSSLTLGRALIALESISEAEVSPVSAAALLRVRANHPRIARALDWFHARDVAILAEHMVNLGRRSALVRTGHFILECAERLRLLGFDTEGGFNLPLNQYLLADALGLTSIHLNRVLRQLREADLATLRSGKFIIHDIKALRELAGFDGAYLAPPLRMS
jgi:CRP-like cAMP-binding protein